MISRQKMIAIAICTVTLALSSIVHGDDNGPIVPEGFVVDTVATEPLVRNPCVFAFDQLGRLCVAQGPQWRGPTPETPGDRVDILIDDDEDGIADRVITFAEGLNSIQGIAWHGNDLWIANAPDLTVVRDTDGDDQGDEYIRVYTGLGNLEHSLHGLNFGPDGKLYMSKGNSKGYNRLDQLAPLAFRELWGLTSPEGAPDYTEVEVFTKENYKRAYHTPQDDWGQQGGILRCDPYGGSGGEFSTGTVDLLSSTVPVENDANESYQGMGRNLEIVSRGYRNPWDICFDDGFDWLGTDNDQTEGDKVFAPFHGANFGWGHPWSSDWKGIDHLPTIPISMPLYEGSGTGVVFYNAKHFPEEYRNMFFVNDWMRREVYMFRPEWYGAFLRHAGGGFPKVFAHADGGRALPTSGGRMFEPTDIEVGPDGSLYILSWGHGYGATIENGKQVDSGRVYRIRHKDSDLNDRNRNNRTKICSSMTLEELWNDLGSSIPAWRVNAQNEFLRRGISSIPFLISRLRAETTKAEQTWGLWTLGRISIKAFEVLVSEQQLDENSRIQTLRILTQKSPGSLDAWLSWNSDNARLRHESVQAVWQGNRTDMVERLVELAAIEQDRIVFYSTWNALCELLPTSDLKARLQDSRPRVRLAALLGLFLNDDIDVSEVIPLRNDPNSEVAKLVELWLEKTGNATTFSAPDPTQDSYRHRAFIHDLTSDSGRDYELDWTGLAVGKRHYTDRDYRVGDIPAELSGMPFLRTANGDDRRITNRLISFRSDAEVTLLIGVDARNPEPLSWMKVGQEDGFHRTDKKIVTEDPTFILYEKRFLPGEITLGANINHPKDSPRGNYIVIFKRDIISSTEHEKSATVDDVVTAMANADSERGRELFLHPQGAGCFKCHRMQGIGNVLAPDLSDIGSRAKSPEVLTESIIHPSKVITEGFAQQQILTVDGRVIAGSVVEESGRTIQVALSDGTVQTIAKEDIEERVGTKLSPMPDGFGKMMTAQQIADLTAWLLKQRLAGDRDGFWFQDMGDSLDIHLGSQRIATYLKRHPQLTRRALVNVTTPTGIQVTRNFPPRKPEDIDPGYQGEDGIIHPIMHAGIWISFGDVHGNDYWRLQSEVEFDRFSEEPNGNLDSASFTAVNRLLSEDGKQRVCVEITRYRFERVPHGWTLQLDVTYQSDDGDFYFGDQEESGLAIRVASPIRVQGGSGTILNDRGERNGAQVWGKEARWFDYFATIDQQQVGIMVVPSPNNPRPSWLHARDYGVVVTNPFPKQPKERREPYVKTFVREGEPYTLSYMIFVHDVPADSQVDHTQLAESLLQSFEE